jgi:hypothetical protein
MLNEKEFEFLGISNWHKKGYKGRNVIIASRENVLPDIFKNVEAYQFEEKNSEWAKHGTNVMDFISQVAPEARKITFEFHGKSSEIFTSPHSKYIQDIVPDILTTSLFGGEHRNPYLEYFTKLYNNGTFLCCAAGNEGSKGVKELANGDMWKAIGACHYNKGKPVIANYSSKGEELDFMSFDALRATWSEKVCTGTSFASPLFAGMIALVQCFFIEKTGHKLNHEALQRFIIDNCKDIDKEGKDVNSGYGIFILPDPDTIDIKKYTSVIDIEEVFEYLREQKELLEPDYWRIKIQEENKLKWMFIKWACAVRFARNKYSNENIYNYNVEPVLKWLNENGYLYEPDYWRKKIEKEPKLRWMFYKWYNAIRRVK